MDNLESFYGDLLRDLPTEEETDLTLDRNVCPRPPEELETSGLLVRGMAEAHGYSDSVRAEVVSFFADSATYRALGLLIFSSIFHSARVVLHVRQEGEEPAGSPITMVVVDDPRREDPTPSVSELRQEPVAYGYWPTIRTDLNPLYDPYWRGDAWRSDLPQVVWSNEAGTWWPSTSPRTALHGFGLAEGAARFAALLLDVGLPGSERTRFCLEGPAGYQSVTTHSAEITLYLGYERS